MKVHIISPITLTESLPAKKGRISDKTIICVKGIKGEKQTSAIIQKFSAKYSPRWNIICGIAGSITKHRGDIVIAKWVYDLDYGKIDDNGKFIHRSENDGGPDVRLLSYCELLAEAKNQDWKQTIKAKRPDNESILRTEAHIGYIASSDKLVDNIDESFIEVLIKTLPEIDAFEMEGSGAGIAIRLIQSEWMIGHIVIRGISDIPESNKTTKNEFQDNGSAQRKIWKAYAAAAVAAFVAALINRLPKK
ncbi:MAG: hypothetical protein A2Y62_10375 [Candidatus Fischerbacteria bacterium RBG_13_37_8]|uniref:Nucleoside phosphorylase domain-containing protein n=1 Tax=Candidatus Fischerbacteria bacterium RBG_13_37_8 TaxID=1817863 RepID=A0A1F5VQS0_9BACT|nr:MAG: hypothetical protein A2Y62_10375 [Candidatus Fischerbacteria bacterium RBG_13_37_8]